MDTSRRAVDQLLVAMIVSSYVKENPLPLAEVPTLIVSVYQSLLGLGEPQPEPRNPAVPIRRSVTRNYVVCLECGRRARTLRRHIRVRHSVSIDEYKRRWGLPSDHALIAPAYSERRAGIAKHMRGRPSAGKAATPRRKRVKADTTPDPTSAC